MSEKYPEKKGLRYTENITIRVEPELREALRTLKRTTSTDVAEAQRMAWRELVNQLTQKKLA